MVNPKDKLAIVLYKKPQFPLLEPEKHQFVEMATTSLRTFPMAEEDDSLVVVCKCCPPIMCLPSKRPNTKNDVDPKALEKLMREISVFLEEYDKKKKDSPNYDMIVSSITEPNEDDEEDDI